MKNEIIKEMCKGTIHDHLVAAVHELPSESLQLVGHDGLAEGGSNGAEVVPPDRADVSCPDQLTDVFVALHDVDLIFHWHNSICLRCHDDIECKEWKKCTKTSKHFEIIISIITITIVIIIVIVVIVIIIIIITTTTTIIIIINIIITIIIIINKSILWIQTTW